MNKAEKTTGMTLVEIVLVLGLIVASIGISALYYRSSQLRFDIRTQASEFVAYLRLTQSNADAGLHGSSHGIHLDPSSYTTFIGGFYDPEDPSNYTITMPDAIVIENIALNGGGSDIIFSGPKGEVTTYGTVDFVAADINKIITITITSVGSINY